MAFKNDFRLLLIFFLAFAQAQSNGPEARAKEFLEILVKQDFPAAQAMLNAAMSAQFAVPKLERLWEMVQQSVGKFGRVTGARTESSETSDVVFLTCEFEKGAFDVRLPVDKAGRIGGLNLSQHVDYTPPDYVDPVSFHEKEVIVGSGQWSVHGTLTIPNGEGPFRALVLVHGSGAANRDYALGPNMAFRDIAWGVATRGIAVLRYNKSVNEHPEMSKLPEFTVKEETIDDALSAVALLRKTPGIDSGKIFVLGHSLGATLIPRIGKADPGIAGLVIMGGTTHSLVDLLVPQTIHNLTQHGPMTPAQQKIVDRLREQVARANDPKLTPDAAASEMPMGMSATYILDLRGYHPEQMARELKQPLLILQGERDYQVTLEDFETWKSGLAGKKNVEFRSYPKLNHLFMPGEGVSTDEEYTRPGHVWRPVIENVSAWMKTF
jgi:dienelactone hydrolase